MTRAFDRHMKVDLEGCVRAVNVRPSHAFLPVFEAVVNSIHSAEERFGDEVAKSGTVKVAIRRAPQQNLEGTGGKAQLPAVVGVTVSDNGLGFNGANIEAFETAYTRAKATRGGKGAGRSSWLIVFGQATIDSVYDDERGRRRRRRFKFKLTHSGIEEHDDGPAPDARALLTSVELAPVHGKYVEGLRHGTEVIADKLFEHCFPYLVMGRCPKMLLSDVGPDGPVTIEINDKLKELVLSDPVELAVGEHRLCALHVQQPHKTDRQHKAHLCAHKREVTTLLLSKESDLGAGPIQTPDGLSLVHHVFVEGRALDESVDTARTGFALPEDETELPLPGALSMKTLRTAIGLHVNQRLADCIRTQQEGNFERIREHIRTQQPEYQILLNQRPADLMRVKWTQDERKLDESLYRVKQAWEFEVRGRQVAIEKAIAAEGTDVDRLAGDLYGLVVDTNQAGLADLAKYVSKRRAVLTLMKQLCSKFQGPAHEGVIHDLVFPRRMTGRDVRYDEHNLWMVDDTLSFYEYLASDLPFNQNAAAPVDSARRPDILAFKSGEPFEHIAIVEFKRPDRKDQNPVQQLVEYGQLLRMGGRKDANGVTLPGIDKSVRIDAYAVVTLTPEMETALDISPGDIRKVEREQRWYGNVPNLNMTVEVLDFRAFIHRAEQRNWAFFKRLGLS